MTADKDEVLAALEDLRSRWKEWGTVSELTEFIKAYGLISTVYYRLEHPDRVKDVQKVFKELKSNGQ